MILSVDPNIMATMVYPILSILFAIVMIVLYLKCNFRHKFLVLSAFPAMGLLYGIIFTFAHCISTLTRGAVEPILIVRSFEGFLLDFVVLIALLIRSSFVKKANSKNVSKKDLNDEQKIEIKNL